ncbi:hypothetical protein ACFL2Z_00010 [Candidatus Eisenbacteria bacterium]|uniref:Uncharacterized protein n=1 Tax=Eiseniibacteriota bacterium TaxID=2212470 RepID=A0ABV6YMI0_UNCEI
MSGATSQFDFRKTCWGMGRAEVSASEGGQPDYEDELILMFSGAVGGLSCHIGYVFIHDHLVIAKYVFTQPHSNLNDYIDDYLKVQGLLSKKYGHPATSDQTWKNDLYASDVEQWGFAISIGHLKYASTWSTERSTIGLVLDGENYSVRLMVEYFSTEHRQLVRDHQQEQELEDF